MPSINAVASGRRTRKIAVVSKTNAPVSITAKRTVRTRQRNTNVRKRRKSLKKACHCT